MSHEEGDLTICLRGYILSSYELMLERELNGFDVRPSVEHIFVIDRRVGYAYGHMLIVETDTGLNDESVVLVFVQEMQSSASTTGFDADGRHGAEHT